MKTLQNVRKQKDFQLCTKWVGDVAKSFVGNPFFKSSNIFKESPVGIELFKTKYLLNEPISIGTAIMDISKCLMYEFHYGHMKQNFGTEAQLMYTDGDNLFYKIHNKVNNETILNDSDVFEKLGNSGIPRLLQIRNKSSVITEFVRLQSTMFGIRLKDRNPIKKAKYAKCNIESKNVNYDNYLHCLTSLCTLNNPK